MLKKNKDDLSDLGLTEWELHKLKVNLKDQMILETWDKDSLSYRKLFFPSFGDRPDKVKFHRFMSLNTLNIKWCYITQLYEDENLFPLFHNPFLDFDRKGKFIHNLQIVWKVITFESVREFGTQKVNGGITIASNPNNFPLETEQSIA